MTIFHNHKVVADNLPWLNDTARNQFYKSAIENTSKGKRVIEAGPGAGLLMQYALNAGAEHVTGVEIRKDRAKFLDRLFSSQGHDNFTILNTDFMQLEESVLKESDILVCEQTGDQFANDCQLMRIFEMTKHLDITHIPNSWNIDVQVYDGHVPVASPLVSNDSIPALYRESVKEFAYPQPTEVFNKIWGTTSKQGHKDVAITLDLTGYKDCTIFIDDYVSYNDKRCPYLTGYQNWQKPVQIMIEDAKDHYNIYFEEGKWNHKKI